MIDNIENKIEILHFQECSLNLNLFLYTVSERYKRDYLHASIDILFYIMFYSINTMKKQTPLYHVCTNDTKKVPIWTCRWLVQLLVRR